MTKQINEMDMEELAELDWMEKKNEELADFQSIRYWYQVPRIAFAHTLMFGMGAVAVSWLIYQLVT